MKGSTLASGAAAVALVVLALVAGYHAFARHDGADAGAPLLESADAPATSSDTSGFLYGRVTAQDGTVREGRLRWGLDQEAFWDEPFNGVQAESRWVAQVPPELQPKERHRIEILGVVFADREEPVELRRQFLSRFGDLTRIESRGREVVVTLKSGTVVVLDRFESSDFDDPVRVWDAERGVADLEPRQIRSIELLPTPPLEALPGRLHGTVRTAGGEFEGFVQWNRWAGLATDEIAGSSATGPVRLALGAVRSIARRADGGAVATLADGREVELARVGGNDSAVPFGIAVEDRRFGRVLIGWPAVERLELGVPGAAGSGPSYGDIAAGRALSGSVTLRGGEVLAGRLVFDLDESETTDTLDAPAEGVDYMIPLGLVASIEPGDPAVRVRLHGGQELALGATGDLGPHNAGVLVFVEGRERPEYRVWSEVARIELDPGPGR